MLDRGNGAAAALEAPAAGDVSAAAQWERIRPLLRQEIGDNNFRSWIQPVTVLSVQAGVLELGVPTRFMRDWVRTHYADRIRALWSQHAFAVTHVDFTVSAAAPAVMGSAEVVVLPAIANDKGSDLSSPLDSRYTFDSFVTGASNEMACAAARKLADGAAGFNPLCLHGGVGMGKTHLMQAAAAAIRARNPAARVVYMSAEKFMYRFVRALREKDTMSFKTALRSIDVLMVDDIQFICGKESTQEEFFHTFNALLDEGKQVVITCDRAPADLEGIDDRLRSRLGMGLVARIGDADAALRLAVLQSKCRLMKREVPEEVLAFLSEKITANIRELEGALNRLIANAELMGRAVTLEGAKDLLQDLLRAGARRASVEDIQKKVADHYGIRVADILSPRRARPVARPRQVAMYLSKILTEHSLPDIGRRFGDRDHTTIMHGIRKIESLMATDTGMVRDVESLKRALMG